MEYFTTDAELLAGSLEMLTCEIKQDLGYLLAGPLVLQPRSQTRLVPCSTAAESLQKVKATSESLPPPPLRLIDPRLQGEEALLTYFRRRGKTTANTTKNFGRSLSDVKTAARRSFSFKGRKNWDLVLEQRESFEA